MPNERFLPRALGLTLGLLACSSLARAASQVRHHRHNAARKPQAAAAPAAPVVRGEALAVTLKDGQRAALSLVNYDRFFLSVVNAKGTRFDIPWGQVAAVDGPSGGDLAMMRGDLTPDTEPVSCVIEYRSPSTALGRALWPGVLIHGAGLRYAGDSSSFVGLAGGEVFGLVLGAFGTYLQYYPNSQDTGLAVPQALITVGAVCFVGTWVWDLAFAPGSARALDSSHGLALEPASRGEGLQLSYRY